MATIQFQEAHIVGPISEHKYTLIVLHGRGSSGKEFAEELFEGRTSSGVSLLQHFEPLGCKWIFPSAPTRMSTVFQEEIREWFDIYSLSRPEERCELQIEGLRQSVGHIHGIIEAELAVVEAKNIALLGISQGFATALHALLSSGHRLGAFVGLSGWIPFQSQLKAAPGHDSDQLLKYLYKRTLELKPAIFSPHVSLSTPIYIGHSKDDTTVDFELGAAAAATLKELGFGVAFEAFEGGGHWVQEPEGYDRIAAFLDSCLNNGR